MTKGNVFLTLIGLAFLYAVVFGGLEHAAKTDPVGREPAIGVDAGVIGHEPAYGAVHGIVIPPFKDQN